MLVGRLGARGGAAVLGAATLWLGAGTAPAWAHVHVSSAGAVRGGFAMLTFEVPNESETGAATTELTVKLPDVASARTAVVPGWTATLVRDTAAGTVQSVTWTAAPGAGIGVDQFGLFQISVKLPDADTVGFPATQTYADGTVVQWDQPPQPDGGEPQHPAPQLTLAAPPQPPTNNIARALAGGALLIAAAGLAVALRRRRG